MRLTRFTNHALRTLMHLALHPGRSVTIGEIARTHGFSANHLMKVVQLLAAEGLVATLRGKRGGLRLNRAAEAIRVGDVIRLTEPELASPADPADDALGTLVDRATAAFMAELDGTTLADLLAAWTQGQAVCARAAPIAASSVGASGHA